MNPSFEQALTEVWRLPILVERGIVWSRILNMERVLKIPQFLAHLKTYGGYPVPFTQLWHVGTPDFRAVDSEHCARCLRDKLCAICGRRLVCRPGNTLT